MFYHSAADQLVLLRLLGASTGVFLKFLRFKLHHLILVLSTAAFEQSSAKALRAAMLIWWGGLWFRSLGGQASLYMKKLASTYCTVSAAQGAVSAMAVIFQAGKALDIVVDGLREAARPGFAVWDIHYHKHHSGKQCTVMTDLYSAAGVHY